jgi:hypothetical protein
MPITVERLPAERGTSMAPVAAAGGCCCCCCCCLHTIGSLAGAATAKPIDPITKWQEPPTAVIGTDKVEPKYDVWREYWISTLILCTVVFPLLFLRDVDPEELTWGPMLLVFAMIFPAVQLAGSLVTFVITYSSKRPGREERLKHLGRITLRAFVGTVIGLFVMIPILALL